MESEIHNKQAHVHSPHLPCEPTGVPWNLTGPFYPAALCHFELKCTAHMHRLSGPSCRPAVLPVCDLAPAASCLLLAPGAPPAPSAPAADFCALTSPAGNLLGSVLRQFNCSDDTSLLLSLDRAILCPSGLGLVILIV